MTSKDQTVKQVLNWRKSGLTFREIGKKLNLSHERARQIYISYIQKQLNRKNLAQIISKIKSKDGLNYFWPVKEFVDAFEFDKLNGVLLSYLERYNYNEISFQEFIDIFLPTEKSHFGRRLYGIPLYRVGGIGIKRYAAIVKRLNELDFGEELNYEIHNRTIQIMRSKKVKEEIFSYDEKHPEFMQKLRSEDGIKIKYPTKDFILSLGFGKLNNVLIENINRFISSEISFLNFLDIFIPTQEKMEKTLWGSISAFRFRNIGVKKYLQVIERLLELDFGIKINQDIRGRIINLKKRFADRDFLKRLNVENI